MKSSELHGHRFGRLTVIRCISKKGEYPKKLSCKCDCGNEITTHAGNLIHGRTKSCGCYRDEQTSKANTTHGLSKTRIYRTWHTMIDRCENPKNKKYPIYGGRGITVGEPWHSFTNWHEDMGEPPTPQHTIDRIDNNGNYCKENCKWSTAKQQANNRRDNVFIEYQGQRRTISEWSSILNIPYATLCVRLKNKHWNVERAFTEKVHNPSSSGRLRYNG